MSIMNRLFRPNSIAVIGGGNWCRNVIRQCQKIGFSGAIWPVHPSNAEMVGLPAYPSVSALPRAPDAAFVGVNRNATVDVVRDLFNSGAGGAVCFASGFLEVAADAEEGATLQNELLEAAGDMRIIGPNCYGFLNYLDGVALWPDQHGGQRIDRGVAIITQSSNIALNLTMQRRGLPIAYMVTVGNQAQTSLAEIGLSLIEDPRVTALGMHIEGIRDVRAFELLVVRARDLNKSIVSLKVGKSEQAQAATVSHTASMAGSDVGVNTLLRRLGIGKVSSLAALIETLKLLHVHGPLSSNRIASLSCSGGEAGLIADAVHSAGLIMPPLNDRQKTELRASLGPLVKLANPMDYHTDIWGDEVALTAVFTAMADPDYAMVVVMLDFPRLDRCSASDWDIVINAMVTTINKTGVPMCVIGSISDNLPEKVSAALVELGIVPFSGLAEAVEAMVVAIQLENGVVANPLYLSEPVKNVRVLTEAQAKQALSDWGLKMPASAQTSSLAAAAKLAAEIGFPVVLKGEGVAHKTEVGAVVLNLTSVGEVEIAAKSTTCDSFFIEEMITGTVVELLVGAVRDPAHGFVLTIAAGGVLAELLEDSTSQLIPATREEIIAGLQQLKIWKLINGFRGAPVADMEAIVDSVLAVQAYVQNHSVEEVEINPLLCRKNDAVVADALVRIGENDVG